MKTFPQINYLTKLNHFVALKIHKQFYKNILNKKSLEIIRAVFLCGLTILIPHINR